MKINFSPLSFITSYSAASSIESSLKNSSTAWKVFRFIVKYFTFSLSLPFRLHSVRQIEKPLLPLFPQPSSSQIFAWITFTKLHLHRLVTYLHTVQWALYAGKIQSYLKKLPSPSPYLLQNSEKTTIVAAFILLLGSYQYAVWNQSPSLPTSFLLQPIESLSLTPKIKSLVITALPYLSPFFIFLAGKNLLFWETPSPSKKSPPSSRTAPQMFSPFKPNPLFDITDLANQLKNLIDDALETLNLSQSSITDQHTQKQMLEKTLLILNQITALREVCKYKVQDISAEQDTPLKNRTLTALDSYIKILDEQETLVKEEHTRVFNLKLEPSSIENTSAHNPTKENV